MNGTFRIALSTPLGSKQGTIHFEDSNGSLSGTVYAMGMASPFQGGRASGNSFSFSGTLTVGLYRFDYTARGTVTGDVLKGTAVTRYGSMPIRGMRM